MPLSRSKSLGAPAARRVTLCSLGGRREGAGEKRELKPYECFSGRLAQNGVLKCEKNSEVGPPAAADAREAWPDGGTPSVAGGACPREKALEWVLLRSWPQMKKCLVMLLEIMIL